MARAPSPAMAPAMRSCQCGEWLTGGDDGDDDADAGCSTSALALAVEEEDAVIFSNNIEHLKNEDRIGHEFFPPHRKLDARCAHSPPSYLSNLDNIDSFRGVYYDAVIIITHKRRWHKRFLYSCQ